MAVNQRKIAEELNLSTATVCRSLRGHPDINSATRKKVIALAAELGYRQMDTSRRRKDKDVEAEKLGSIGVALFWPQGAMQGPSTGAYHMLAGISEASQKTRNSLVTYFVPPERCRQIVDSQYQFPEIQVGTLSGLVLISDFPREVVLNLAGMVPCVTIVHSHLDIGVDCIDNGHSEGIGMLMHHLYRLGHRRIGFLSGARRWSWVYPRFAGYLKALNQLALPRDEAIELNVSNPCLDVEAQADAVVEHVSRGVTAWVCVDDYIGYDLCPLLTARGLRIPQDVSLTGFSGLGPPRENYPNPRFTSVHPPFEEMGAAAVRRLIHRIEHPSESAYHIQFGCEFVKGGTTAPPAESKTVNEPIANSKQ